MPENEKRRFAEAPEHWAEAVHAIRARDRAEAIPKIEELRSMHLMRAFHTSALWEHYAWKRRAKGERQMQKAQRWAGLGWA
ncbi:hypothetical protein [Pseudomonas aeruginosa]|uniref:hypothetical protein n=1 Tax=Pseudomonas aeruginosa TaxID=287 RepID=UPI0005B80B9F|nr:hypothetical protein [Pseudomonas aeruginosa]MDV6775035.1 hypothetical protein [Pseudomonas aeruginosa]